MTFPRAGRGSPMDGRGDGKVKLEPHAASQGAHGGAPHHPHPGLEAGLLSAALRGAPARGGGLEGLGLADSFHAAGALGAGGGGMLGFHDPHAGAMANMPMAGGIGLQEFEQEHLFAVPTDGECQLGAASSPGGTGWPGPRGAGGRGGGRFRG